MRLDQPRLFWVATGLLSFLLALEWLWPSASPRFAPAPRHVGAHVAQTPLRLRDTADWEQTVLARPLFSISRRPPKATAHNGAVLAAGQARLAGILIGARGRRAIFAPDGGGKQMVLAEGAAVNESTIRRIQPDRVILASGTVLLPAYDHNRVPSITPPFNPLQPGFPNPNFQNPNFQPPAFPNPVFPNPAFAPQGAQPQFPGEEGGGAPPNPRNPMIPQRRE